MIVAVARVWTWWIMTHAIVPVASEPWDGRVLTRDNIHIGARPHSDDIGEWVITVQVTVRTPW